MLYAMHQKPNLPGTSSSNRVAWEKSPRTYFVLKGFSWDQREVDFVLKTFSCAGAPPPARWHRA